MSIRECVCGQKLRVSDTQNRVRCPRCGAMLAPPTDRSQTVGLAQSSEGRAFDRAQSAQTSGDASGEDKGARGTTVERIALYAGIGTLVIAVITICVVVVVLRSQALEKEREERIVYLTSEAARLVDAGRLDEAEAKYQEMFDIAAVGPIRDENVQSNIEQARAAFERLGQRIQESRQRVERRRVDAERQQKAAEESSRLRSLEVQAEAFFDSADFENAVQKYEQALELIRDAKSNNAEFGVAAGRISHGKTLAEGALVKQREEAEAARRRIADDRRMASIKAIVKGGAWLTKKAGNSETLRGLKLFVLRSAATRDQLLAVLQEQLVQNRDRLRTADAVVALWEKAVRESPNNELIAERFAEKKRSADLLRELNRTIESQVRDAAQIPATATIDLKTIFAFSRQQEDQSAWIAVCAQQLVATTSTDVDGKYSFELTGGNYYLYAMFESAYSEVTWFVPVKVNEARDIRVDIHNETAETITNKK